jgi:hypothetical protein
MKTANALISIGTTVIVVVIGLILQGYFALKSKSDKQLEGKIFLTKWVTDTLR